MPTMLSKALSSGLQQPPVQLQAKSSGSNLFTSDYPFPCLLNPEENAEKDDDDTTQRDQEEDDMFEVFDDDFDDADLRKLRLASNTTIYASSAPQTSHLVSFVGVRGCNAHRQAVHLGWPTRQFRHKKALWQNTHI